MDPLVPVFVAVLLAGVTDQPPRLIALLADRYGVRATVPAAILAQGAGFALAAVGGLLVAPHLTPNARALLLALALVAAGGGAFFPARRLDRLEGWRLPGALTTLLGVFILTLGDRSQFLAFALTARTPDPALATIGAVLAGAIPSVVAATLGEGGWRRLPLLPVRIVSGTLLLLAGAVTGLGALRLV